MQFFASYLAKIYNVCYDKEKMQEVFDERRYFIHS